MEKSLDSSKKSGNMAPNIDEIKIPDVSEFNEDDDDFFEVLDSDMDNINSALDQIEERANTILEAIQALTKSMKEDRCGPSNITEDMENVAIEENDESNKDELK